MNGQKSNTLDILLLSHNFENKEVFNFYDEFYSEILREFQTIDASKKYPKTWFQPEYDNKKEG